jgi:quercetin 2,3-dioxygenase
MLELRLSTARGHIHHGWLEAKHSFSFGNYVDPAHRGFSDLLVINEDKVQANKGFGTHPHRDMEIFTYVLEGVLAHQDSMGTGSSIYPHDVQMMSAGSGITHSEYNASTEQALHLLQIWIVPNQRGVTPRYQQVHFAPIEKRGKLRLIIAPNGEEGALSVYQDVRVYAGLFDGEEEATLTLAENRYAYIHIARGSVEVNGVRLQAGDGAKVREERVLKIQAGQEAEILIFDLRPQALPKKW